jgi:hypothetical protein
VVIKTEVIKQFPPSAYLEPCSYPFDEPPKTHSQRESAIRDTTWILSFSKCAAKIDKLIEWSLRHSDESKNYEQINPG